MTSRVIRSLVIVAVAAGIAAGGYFTRETWLPWFQTDSATDQNGEKKQESSAEKVATSAPSRSVRALM